MRNKKLFIISGVLLIIAIICGIIIFSRSNKEENDNSIPESERALLVLYKNNIANESEISYEKGDRINIILKDSNTEYEYTQKPYMENVKIYEVKEDSISLWVPFDYESFITAMQSSPLITIEIAKATDPNGVFKVNKELHKLLDEKYSIPADKE